MEQINVTNGGKNLIEDSELMLAHGRRYGLVGRNGTGKSTFLRALVSGEIRGLPKHAQVLHVEQEVVGDDTSVIQVLPHPYLPVLLHGRSGDAMWAYGCMTHATSVFNDTFAAYICYEGLRTELWGSFELPMQRKDNCFCKFISLLPSVPCEDTKYN